MLFKLCLRLTIMGFCGASLSACMVGPNFHSPLSPQVKRYTEVPLPKKTVSTKAAGDAGKTQYFVTARNIPTQWWHLFHSKAINQLVQRGIVNSPTLAAAYSALKAAQENFNAQVGSTMLPAFSAQLGGQRQLFSGATIGGDVPNTIFNLFNATVNASYTLDVFGGLRRQIESYGAQVDYQQFELIAAYLTLTSNIATTAITIASLQAQIKATHSLIASQQDQLRIIKDQYRFGAVSKENVLTQQTLVAQTIATLPPLEKSLSFNRHTLSTLVGAYPDEPLPEVKLDDLVLPTHLPVTLPSSLVRQRPDVRASEALLHAASAQIGVATANLFPQFNITAVYGWQALSPQSLFSTSSNAWSWGMQITQPIFQGNALFARRRAAIASYNQALAQYKQTVLQGFQNVADSLRAIELDAKALQANKSAELSAKSSLNLAEQQYKLGGASYLSLLTAQQQYQQTLLVRIQSQAARYTDTVALFQSLGGGWWNKPWCVKECLYEKQ